MGRAVLLYLCVSQFWLLPCLVYSESQVLRGSTQAVHHRILDANRMRVLVRNDGILGLGPFDSHRPVFDLDGIPLVYTAGLYLAAEVDGEIRASGADYVSDFAPGVFGPSGNPYGRDDSTFRVYKIRRGDGPGLNPDWEDWPSAFGAPVDSSGCPLLLGDQTLWTTFVDGYQDARHINICSPLAAEVHLTAWGWHRLENVIFLRYMIVNEGAETWKDAYVGLFVDADVGDAQNDLVGSDGRLHLVYAYDSPDKVLEIEDGAAVGYLLLEAPLVPSAGDTALTLFGTKPGFRNATAYSPWVAKHWPRFWTMPAYRRPETARQIYERLQARDLLGQPCVDRSTGYRTRWAFGGDPITRRGWVDTLSSDRFMMISAGPFDAASGDTATFGLAVLAVQNRDVLAAVDELKEMAGALRSATVAGVGIYTEPPGATPRSSQIRVPVRLVRFRRVEQLSFDFHFDPRVLRYLGVETHGVAEVETWTPEEGAVSLSFTGIIQSEGVAADTIATLKFELQPTASPGRYRYALSNAAGLTTDGEQVRLNSVTGYVALWNLPEPARLVSPGDGDVVRDLVTHFRWTDDTTYGRNRYTLTVSGRRSRRHTLWASTLTLPTTELYSIADSSYELLWWTEATNWPRRIPSEDTFTVRLRPLNELTFLGEESRYDPQLDTTKSWNLRAACEMPYVFALAKERTGDSGRLMVLKVEPDGLKLLLEETVATNGLFAVDLPNVVVARRQEGFDVFRLHSDRELVRRGSGGQGEAFFDLLVTGDYLFALVTGGQLPALVVYDVSVADSARLLASLPFDGWRPDQYAPLAVPARMTLCDSLLFVAADKVYVLDVQNPACPSLLATITEPEARPQKLAASDGLLYVDLVRDGNHYLVAYDVRRPANPTEVHREPVPLVWYNPILAIGSRLYVPFPWWLAATHLTPGHSWPLDRLDSLDGMIVWAVTPEVVLYSTDEGDLALRRNLLPSRVTRRTSPVPEDVVLEPAFPNPFNSRVRLVFNLPRTGRVLIRIYDIRGRLVRELSPGLVHEGWNTLTWDGKDAYGRSVPSGIYLIMLRSWGETRLRKVVCVR